MKFRQDINGLRAIAVLVVTVFHFYPQLLPGGFVGVDIFFVISGFLMTSIIFKGFDNDNFSLLKFYLARAYRIIPALAVMCLSVLVVTYFLIIPPEFELVGKHVFSSLTFVSNLAYLREAGYFDVASKSKWLLHTWSLSVEWQFYIVYPLLLIVLKRFIAVSNLKYLIVLTTVLSFFFSVYLSKYHPEQAYFLLSSRVWEMTAGALVFFYPFNSISNSAGKLLQIVGLALILTSVFLITEDIAWPGAFAILPVAGTVMILIANTQKSVITGNLVSQMLGKWSYSIYLWHWPIVVAFIFFSIDNNLFFLGILLSVFMGWLSYTYIESISIKKGAWQLSDVFKLKLPYFVAVVASLGLMTFIFSLNSHMYQMPQSVSDSFVRGKYECFDKPLQHEKDFDFCSLSTGDKKLFVFGDSHSYSALPVIDTIAKSNNMSLAYSGYSGCPPLVGIRPKRDDQITRDCFALTQKIIQFLSEEKVELVVLAARWTYYTEGDYQGESIQLIADENSSGFSKEISIQSFKNAISETLQTLQQMNINVVILLQVPMQLEEPERIFYRSVKDGKLHNDFIQKYSVTVEQHQKFQEATNNIIKDAAENVDNVVLIDPTPFFCNDVACPAGNQEASFYFDDDHLSIKGTGVLHKVFESSILESLDITQSN